MKNASTNEAFQRRIEAVQWGRDTTHAECVAKRSLREQLESDVAEFLAKGGAVQEIAAGYSYFKDGIIPRSAVKPITGEADRLAREKAIEDKNAEIRKQKEALKLARQAIAKKRYDAQIKEQVEILGEFYAKSVNKSDLKVLADVGDYQVQHMTNAMKGHTKLGPEKWELIKKAIAKFKFAAADGSKKTKGAKAA